MLREDGLKGYGKHIERPTHSQYFEQARMLHARRQVTPVKRDLSAAAINSQAPAQWAPGITPGA